MDSGIVYAFDIFGTAIFAITGAVKGVRNRLDFLGIFPIAVFRDNAYVLVCIAMGILVFLLSPKAVGRWSIIQYLDAVGLGVFTAIGCVKAEALGLGAVGVMASGVFGAVGGGVLRDVFCHEIPMVLTSDFYASASILGGLLFVLLFHSGVSGDVLMYSTAVFTMVLRMLGYHFRWKLPVARMVGEAKRDR